MEVLHERCAGLDISKRDVKACVRIPSPRRKGARSQQVKTFATMTNALLALRDWLVSEQVSVVAMEARSAGREARGRLARDSGRLKIAVNAPSYFRPGTKNPSRPEGKADQSYSFFRCNSEACVVNSAEPGGKECPPTSR
jgi:hypothetical protein